MNNVTQFSSSLGAYSKSFLIGTIDPYNASQIMTTLRSKQSYIVSNKNGSMIMIASGIQLDSISITDDKQMNMTVDFHNMTDASQTGRIVR